MRGLYLWSAWVVFGAVVSLPAQDVFSPHLGYAYPAGGKRGTEFEVMLGGQFLRNPERVYVSGAAIEVEVVDYANQYRRRLIEHMRTLRRDLAGPFMRGRMQEQEIDPRFAVAPDMPPFRHLSSLSPLELKDIGMKFRDMEGQQQVRELDEVVLLRIRIPHDAAIGPCELRLETQTGLSNPIRFEVSAYHEILEREPNDDRAERIDSSGGGPLILNGQVMPGDIDKFRIGAKKGQHLVVETRARKLIPYLADAVPGWFQAVVKLEDAAGREVGFADDFNFDPDPVLLFEVPADGEYVLSIRDSIYRGRADFVYRISVGETPFVTSIYPLGGSRGQRVVAQLEGWNLGAQRVELATDKAPGYHAAFLNLPHGCSNPIHYAVGDGREQLENEPNDALEQAEPTLLPVVLNGQLSEPGDVDCFLFEGRTGDSLTLDVDARELYSPLDSLLRVFGPTGEVLVWNDDDERPNVGLLTHHADSKVDLELPANGAYVVQVSDARGHGGKAYGYRLSIAPPEPGYRIKVSPTSLKLLAGTCAPVTFHVERLGGYEGPIQIDLVDAPKGFRLTGGPVPAGANAWVMTVASPRNARPGGLTFAFEAEARIDGILVKQTALPVDEVTQAFITPHLLESRYVVASVSQPRRLGRGLSLETKERSLRMTAGKRATLHVEAGILPRFAKVGFELLHAPEGIRIESVDTDSQPLKVVLRADPDLSPGDLGNLVIGATMEIERRGPDEQMHTIDLPLGALPAVGLKIATPKPTL